MHLGREQSRESDGGSELGGAWGEAQTPNSCTWMKILHLGPYLG